METTSYTCRKERSQRSLPDGAKLLSIIDRLTTTGQHGSTVSPGRPQERKAVVVCQEKESQHGNRIRSNHYKPSMARGKQTDLRCKIYDHNENMDLCEIGPRLNPDKQFSLEEFKTEKQSMTPNDLQGSRGVKTTDLLFSKKVKFSLKVRSGSSEEVTPVVCLCKPPNPVTNPENRTPDDTINDVSQKNEESSCGTSNTFKNSRDTMSPISIGAGFRKSSCICGICLQRFPTAFFLDKHRRQSKHYLCSGCGKDFDDPAVFEKHGLNKECEARSCSMCGRKFILARELATSHSRCPECQIWFKKTEKSSAQNNTNPSYLCTECGKTFHVHSRYKTHMMAAHTGDRPFVCPQCGRGFARMYALNTHIKYTHSDEKKFKCEFCPKTFKRKDHLKNHIVTHSSKKPYRCEVCGQGFNQRISLKKHLPCSDGTKARATEGPNQTITTKKSSERCCLDGISNIPNNSKIPKNFENAQPSGTIQRKPTDGYLSCRCQASCECKKITIAVSVSSEDSQNSSSEFREVGTLPCCCNIELGGAISKNNV